MDLTLPMDLPIEQIIEFCQRKPIRKLSLFGSILREDFKPESDVDMLVEFIPNSRVGYFELIGMETELTEMLKRKVDLRTSAEISRYFRQRVLDFAQVIYEHR